MEVAACLALNNYDLTSQWVDDVLAQDVPTMALVFDNGSTDRTTERLEARGLDNLVIVRSDTNLGVAPGWDQICHLTFGGIVCAPVDRVLICNNDIRLRPDTVRHLLVPRGGFVTPINVGDWEKCKKAGFLVEEEPAIKGGPDFSCFLLYKWLYEKLGGFPKCYPLGYFEDRDTHMQLLGMGLGDQIFSVTFPYYHVGSATIKNNPEIKALNDVQFELNKQTFIKRWGGPPHCETRTTPLED